MKIGIDLDHVVYGFPEFFAEFISAMANSGHKFFCTSNHFRHCWETDKKKLEAIGINPDLIDPSLMQTGPMDGGAKNKARMADHCDLVFDDAADIFQHMTNTPVFKCPQEKSREMQCG